MRRFAPWPSWPPPCSTVPGPGRRTAGHRRPPRRQLRLLQDWIKHLEANGFEVTDHVEADMSAVKSRLGVPYSMGSCHTGVIDGKFVEGHVPAADILKLRERADLVGAAVPGMPVGSPGMEMGDRQDAYQVVGLTRSGQASVLAEYPGR